MDTTQMELKTKRKTENGKRKVPLSNLVPHRLLVTRDPSGKFILRIIRNRRVIETVTAANAQLICDYLNAEWPVGTRVQWIIR